MDVLQPNLTETPARALLHQPPTPGLYMTPSRDWIILSDYIIMPLCKPTPLAVRGTFALWMVATTTAEKFIIDPYYSISSISLVIGIFVQLFFFGRVYSIL